MGLLDTLRLRRDERRYGRQCDEWLAEGDASARRLFYALAVERGELSGGLSLRRGERFVGALTVSLVMPQTSYVRNTTGGSYRVGESGRAFSARSVTSSAESRKIVDHGTVTLTDQRAVFTGGMKTIEWWFGRVLSWEPTLTDVTIHVSGRQRAYAIAFGSAQGRQVLFLFELAMALYTGDRSLGCRRDVDDLKSQVLEGLEPPRGVETDPRIAEARQRWHTALAVFLGADPLPGIAPLEQAMPALAAGGGPITDHTIGFERLPAVVVAEAARSLGDVFLFDAADIAATVQDQAPSDAAWTLVLDGHAPGVLDGIDSAKVLYSGATRVLVCAPRGVLDDLGLEAVDERSTNAEEVAYGSTTVDDVAAAAAAEGAAVVRHALRAGATDDTVVELDALCALARLGASGEVEHAEVVLVVAGAAEHLQTLRGRMTIADRVAFVTDAAGADVLGLPALDAPTTPTPDDEELPVINGPTVVVAGREVGDAAAAVLTYLVDHAGTIQHYDLVGGTFTTVTAELVAATRRPWMNSRISAQEEKWFVDSGASAPWHLLPRAADLADADPVIVDGLYDRGLALWNHFASSAPKGVAGAKISKVLHLMYPGFYPILDTFLRARYDALAQEAARDLSAARPGVQYRRAYWEAIRREVVVARPMMAELRRQIRDAEVAGASETIDRLSDVRLLDILAWDARDNDQQDD